MYRLYLIDNIVLKDVILHLPYKFKLLLRGSQDGFTPKAFHSLCDDCYIHQGKETEEMNSWWV